MPRYALPMGETPHLTLSMSGNDGHARVMFKWDRVLYFISCYTMDKNPASVHQYLRYHNSGTIVFSKPISSTRVIPLTMLTRA